MPKKQKTAMLPSKKIEITAPESERQISVKSFRNAIRVMDGTKLRISVPQGDEGSDGRRYLASDPGAQHCGLFWDYASLPQRGRDGTDRTAEEVKAFKSGLDVMAYFYASLTGTGVLQLKDVPTRPSQYDGRIALFFETKEKPEQEALRAEMSAFGQVVDLAIFDTHAHVWFAIHEHAVQAVEALRRQQRGVDYIYNTTAYDCERGEHYSGWCTFEQGACTVALAHLSAAEKQAASRGGVLPARIARAQMARPKVIDISDGEIRPRVISEPPEVLLNTAINAIEHATFVGKGDQPMVQQMLAELEWTMKTAMDEAELAHKAHELSIDPKLLSRAAQHIPGLSRLSNRLSLHSAPQESEGGGDMDMDGIETLSEPEPDEDIDTADPSLRA